MSEAAEPEEPAGRPAAGPRRSRRGRAALWLGLALTAAAALFEVLYVTLGSNWHCVVPGRLYRSAQLSPEELQEKIEQHGIRTVLNLRGCCNPQPWYVAECRATHAGGVAQEDVCLSAGRYPSRSELLRLVEVLDNAEYPILMHCRRGADRTGLVAAVYFLLQEGSSPADARRQLGPRYGHLALLRTVRLDEFCDQYEGWLARSGRAHAPALFREWLRDHYRAGHCCAEFEQAPRRLGPLPTGRPTAVHVRVRNRGTSPWRLHPLPHAGVHLAYLLTDLEGNEAASGRAGLFHAEVAPGQCVELTVPLPSVYRPGRYRLLLDMIDEAHGWFFQMGSEPVECEVLVGE